jgi:hypothetical protein
MKKKVSLLLFILSLVVNMSYSQTAKEYFDRGKAKEEKIDYKAANIEYSRAIDADSNYQDAFLERGCYQKANVQ